MHRKTSYNFIVRNHFNNYSKENKDNKNKLYFDLVLTHHHYRYVHIYISHFPSFEDGMSRIKK